MGTIFFCMFVWLGQINTQHDFFYACLIFVGEFFTCMFFYLLAGGVQMWLRKREEQ